MAKKKTSYRKPAQQKKSKTLTALINTAVRHNASKMSTIKFLLPKGSTVTPLKPYENIRGTKYAFVLATNSNNGKEETGYIIVEDEGIKKFE